MPILKHDVEELRRMATNTYDDEKRFLNRVIVGITEMEREIIRLGGELERAKKSITKLKTDAQTAK